ncbi:hypothetical protein FOPG_00623 [Fusarium oxysporum f. sp. conglutinans race 2 54008]|uniref:Uncharacterized protein n=2 Tax=Fusarium oxysporum TaxID=5507 RepID=X0M036_FUSOX|nr:hypothetical protein FOPG_00623 [Fusarium oxysporum f. sp. conglutinans race 2 54008]EXM31604.1 hypothetical protein FOTG_03364 [Fusarium oxysporum f. sp. vasinfectum 25433]KAI8409929.1 hypothetical protein FOFC_09773 [Fusarium oxysporum]
MIGRLLFRRHKWDKAGEETRRGETPKARDKYFVTSLSQERKERRGSAETLTIGNIPRVPGTRNENGNLPFSRHRKLGPILSSNFLNVQCLRNQSMSRERQGFETVASFYHG